MLEQSFDYWDDSDTVDEMADTGSIQAKVLMAGSLQRK